MNQYMNERAAWKMLSFVYDGPVVFDNDVSVPFAKATFGGLCSAINWLQSRSLISKRTANVMRTRYVHRRNQPGTGYKWPRDEAGMRLRAVFCRQQAARQ